MLDLRTADLSRGLRRLLAGARGCLEDFHRKEISALARHDIDAA